MTKKLSSLSLGETIRISRSRLGISQAELADTVGVHSTTLRRWEYDFCPDKMKVVQLKKIAQKLYLPIPEVFNSKGKLLRKLRFRMNMLPAELAVRLEVSTSTIVRWERQESFDQIPLRQFKKIAQIANIQLPDYLVVDLEKFSDVA